MIIYTRVQEMIKQREDQDCAEQSEEWHRTKRFSNKQSCRADAEHKVQGCHSAPLLQLHWQMEKYK